MFKNPFKKKEKKLVFSQEVLDNLTTNPTRVSGDGNAVFIGQGDAKEFKDFENEKKGLRGVFGL